MELEKLIQAPDLSEKAVELEAAVNHLINTDFNRLIQVLYRIDINESLLKYTLKTNAEKDAAKLITKLIIDRQIEKARTRGASGASEWKDV
ncbi:MAG: hypothetical protein K2P88_08460 [Chitinophagaceae bacterium]|nr:hypothetical protein [Chitinophagaceae bacterium]